MEWIESSAFAEWVRTSFVGYPMLLTLHSIGMAIMVGLMFVVSLRLVGRFQRIPYVSLEKLITIAWVGFAINLISGAALFTSQATFYVTSWPFLLKIATVLVGVALAGYMQPLLKREAADWVDSTSVPSNARTLAIASIVMWSVAITTGRFTAYL